MKLKRKMTFEQMARHMEEYTLRTANRVSVGRYARENGYRVYKPRINGTTHFFYINDALPEEPENKLRPL